MNNLQEQGRALYKRGEHVKAIELFDRAIGHAPSVQLLDNRAACYEKLGDLPAALKDAKKTIQHHREDATGYLRAGKILTRMEKKTVALDIYTHGLKCIKHVGQGYELLRKVQKELMDELCPPKSVDPLTVLPRELAEIILEYLSFKQRMNACLVSKQWTQFIRSCPSLWKHLDLSGARRKVKTAFVSRAINVGRKSLTAATLSNLYDFEKTLTALVKHCPLEQLRLLQTGLQSGTIATATQSAKHLKRLTISPGTQVGDAEFKELLWTVPESLESLDCSMPRGCLTRLPAISNLQVLSFRFGRAYGRQSNLFATISQNLPNLKSLCVRYEGDAQNGLASSIDLDGCSRLEHLDLVVFLEPDHELILPKSLKTLILTPCPSSARSMTPSFMRHDPRCLPNLTELTLEGHWRGFEISVLRLIENGAPDGQEPPDFATMTKLRKLSIIKPNEVEILPNMLSLVDVLAYPRVNSLEELRLSHLIDLNDAILKAIQLLLPNLQSLDVSGSDVTGVGIKELVKDGHLKKLCVNDCRLLGSDAVDWARAQGVEVQYRMNDAGSGGRKVRY